MSTLVSYVLVVLLAIIASTLIVLAARPTRRIEVDVFGADEKIVETFDGFNEKLINTLGRINQAAAHHVEVNAVLALSKSFVDNPELLYNLAGYSRQVVAAALLMRVNALGNDIKVVQESLSYAIDLKTRDSRYASTVEARTQELVALQAELVAANQAAQQFAGLHLVK